MEYVMEYVFVLAGAAPGRATEGGGFDMVYLIIMFAPLILVFYLLAIRPQKKREQERKAMLAKIRKGDRVTTVGGIYGEVTRLNEREATLLVDKRKGVEIRVIRSALSGVVDDHKGAEGSEGEAARERRL